MSRMITARVESAKYEIPEIWIVGWLQGHRIRGEVVSYEDAVLYWHAQAQMDRSES